MNPSVDPWMAVSLSVGIHVALFSGLTRLDGNPWQDVSLFKSGQSSVRLTLLPVAVPADQTQPNPLLPDALSVVVEPTDPEDGNLLEKGVETLSAADLGIIPEYPLSARLRYEQGDVEVQIKVDSAGRVIRVTVEDSCGYPALERAAVNAAYRARFPVQAAPLMEQTLRLVFRFNLLSPERSAGR
ncbi:MAG: hypothetical protein A2498_07235 [Lentisphaerae bacterium RIFOXYC12_FULL_60_16]|nr:MAG: hypothetical protein A2498_07235 [Lentisphaerae bacterium RIFOXYC12_FULL_60_16]OGV70242.1 MAG: hypothetical protein A2269_08435 [Lentisphaerae bacterium RIFOXYA12_FULL_60_10]OGV86479.1 MAG: hypothetical protein A2340_09035 [Lentisphaerae bacterium RIFOXYB12_FULL_60_10]